MSRVSQIQLPLSIAAIIIWMVSIIYVCYVPEQSDFIQIGLSLAIAFLSYFFLCFRSGEAISLKLLLCLAIVTRVALIPAFPNLSDDIYRFLWDGELWHLGVHPFSSFPTEISQHFPHKEILLSEMNSPTRYTIYPAVPQLIFYLTTYFSDSIYTSAIWMKIIHLCFDMGSILILWKLILQFGKNAKHILLFAFNPLIIIETIHNLHHEGIVIFFVLLVVFCFTNKKVIGAAIALALAIATKLLPLLFFPLLFFQLRERSRWIFTGVLGVACLFLFAPLFYQLDLLEHLGASTDLYIRKFEFNGGLYSLLRGIGYAFVGYNLIHIIGPALWSIAAIGILLIAFKNRQRVLSQEHLVIGIILSYLCYLLCSATLHPWYVSLLIPLSALTNFRFAYLWSALIMMTYINYSYPTYQENPWVVAIEYTVVVWLLWRESDVNVLMK